MGNELDTTGRLVSIQRCSVHDGPGIRTTVFVKGCQLNCAWCHNPESIAFEEEEFFYPDKCIHCGMCSDGCYAGAREKCGSTVTVRQVMEEVLQDRPYYGEEGGITVSGGEPLCQTEFTEKLLDACKKEGIHTGMESNLCVPESVFGRVLPKVELLMADCKCWSPELHKKWTGHSNEFIKRNFMLAAEVGVPIIMRTPVVGGVNDEEGEIERIAEFAASLPTLKYYELLAYHPLGVGKAKALGRNQERFETPSKEKMNRLARIAADKKIDVLINSKRYTYD